MISRLFRFHGHNSVRVVYRRGRAARASIGSLHWYADARTKNPRVAVVVSRKVHKSAVVRNRIRRRVYELVRVRLKSMPRPAQMVFTIYQSDAATMPHAELAGEVDALLDQAGLVPR